MIALLCVAALPSAQLVSKAETDTWYPLEMAAVASITQQAAVASLSGELDVRTNAVKPAFRLEVATRMIEEAESAQLIITLTPEEAKSLPSMAVSEVTRLSGMNKTQMAAALSQTATRVAARLRVLVKQPEDNASVRFRFSEPAFAKVLAPSAERFLDTAQSVETRLAALVALIPRVATELGPRHAVLACALSEADPKLRAACVEACTAAAGEQTAVQDVVLHVLREDPEPSVKERALAVARGFFGVARRQAVQSLLYVLTEAPSNERTQREAFAILAADTHVPNLDYAVARCLQRPPRDERKALCALLVEKRPLADRWRIAQAWLRTPPARLLRLVDGQRWAAQWEQLAAYPEATAVLRRFLAPSYASWVRVMALSLLSANRQLTAAEREAFLAQPPEESASLAQLQRTDAALASSLAAAWR